MRRWGQSLVVVLVLSLSSCVSFSDVVRAAMANEADSGAGPASSRAEPADSRATVRGKALDSRAWQAKLTTPASDRKIAAGVNLGTKSAGVFALQEGAWALYRVTKGSQVSLFSMATFSRKGLWVYEIVTYEKGKANALQLVYRGLEKVVETGRSDAAELVEFWTMDQNGELSRLDGALAGSLASGYSRSLTPAGGTSLVAGGSVTVPYGTFASTWLGTDAKSKSQAWVHSGAPFFHLVKSVSDNGATVMELMDGASSGYQSVFPADL